MCEAEVNSLKDLVNTIEWENKNYLKGKRFASGALLAQVEQLEQVNIQLFKEKDRRLKPIREQVRKAAYLMEASFHTVGVKADGTVVAVGDNDYGQCEVGSWRDIVAVSAGTSYTVGVKADGTVVAVGENGDDWREVSTWRLFQQLDTLEQERIDGRIAREKQDEEERIAREKQEEEERVAREKQEEEERVAREKQEEEARIAAERREAGLCQHCGGQLKGLFSKKCVVCGKPKDY